MAYDPFGYARKEKYQRPERLGERHYTPAYEMPNEELLHKIAVLKQAIESRPRGHHFDISELASIIRGVTDEQIAEVIKEWFYRWPEVEGVPPLKLVFEY